MSVSIGLPLANAQGVYLGSKQVSPTEIETSLPEVVNSAAVGLRVEVLDQELHLGEDGLVVHDPRTQSTSLFLSRLHIAEFKVTSIDRYPDMAALTIAALDSREDTLGHPNAGAIWIVHVILMNPTMAERVETLGNATIRKKAAIEAGMDGLRLGEDQEMTITLERGLNGYGFVFSTNQDQYVEGVNHYVSSVENEGAAHNAGLRAGHRIVGVNGRQISNFSHEMVLRLIASFAGMNRLSLVIKGANDVIKDSLRKKNRVLSLSNQMPLSNSMPSPRKELFKPIPAVLEPFTIVEKQTRPEKALLAPVSWHDLESSLQNFRKSFQIPTWVPSFQLENDHRKALDVAHFHNTQGGSDRTLALTLCTDVLVVTEWTHTGHYLLIARPTPRTSITAKLTKESKTFIVYLSPQKFYIMEASSALEALEWVQLLSEPNAVPVETEPPVEPYSPEDKATPPEEEEEEAEDGEVDMDELLEATPNSTESKLEDEEDREEQESDDELDLDNLASATQEEGHDSEESDTVVHVDDSLAQDQSAPQSEDEKSEIEADDTGLDNDEVDEITPAISTDLVHERVNQLSPKMEPRNPETYFTEVTPVKIVPDDAWKGTDQSRRNSVSLELTAEGHTGSFSYVNGKYVVVDREDHTGRPCYRHMSTEVKYPGAEEALPLYLYFHERNQAWAIGPQLNSDSVLAFCGHLAKYPEQADTGWVFLADQGASSSTVDENFTIYA
eukprot:m.341329 g.341329  ORF g.341329 m.341329 type:complete len:726 (-) comp20015_c0_seq1:103-2280(-)